MLFFEDLKYKGSSMAIQSSCERQYRMGQSDITTPVLALSQVFPGTVWLMILKDGAGHGEVTVVPC